MDIRMMGFDMDGTLLGVGGGHNGGFPDINCAALQECERRGIVLVFCSGRNFETLRKFAKYVGINPILASHNGACIDASIDGPTIFEGTYDAEHSQIVYRALMRTGLYFRSFTRGHAYIANIGERLERHSEFTNTTVFDEGDGYFYEQVVDAERMKREGTVNPYKYVAWGEMYDPRFEQLTREFAPLGMSISASWGDNIEIMMPGVDKGSAMRLLAERHGFSADQVMVFGDQTNDISMLEYAGWPVAMENAVPEAKKIARIIAPHHGEGGVGQVIYRYILAEEGAIANG